MQTIVIVTCHLNDGTTVLAHNGGRLHGSAKTFANRTQAERWQRALTESGQTCHVAHRGRPFYVVLEGGLYDA